MKKLFFLCVIFFLLKCIPLKESNPLALKLISEIQNANFEELDVLLSGMIDGIGNDVEIQYLLIKAPKDLYLKYRDLIIDSDILHISELSDHYNNLREYDLIELHKKLDSNLNPNIFLKFELVKYDSYLNKIISDKNLELISSVNYKELSVVELYSYLELLEFLGVIASISDLDMGFSFLAYALSILEDEKLVDNFNILRANIYFNFAKILLKESLLEPILAKKFMSESIKIFDSLSLEDELFKCNWAISIHENKSQRNLLKEPHEIEALKLPLRNKIYISTDYGVNFLESNPNKSLRYFNFSNKEMESNSCFYYKQVIANLIGHTCFQLGEDIKAKNYFDSTWDLDACDQKNKWDSQFYNITIQKDILPELDPNFTLQDGINLRMKQRALADSLQISTDHLGDYFAINAIEILELIDQQAKPTQGKISEVLNLVNDTKYRELKRLRSVANKSEDSSSSTQIKSLLREIDNFKKIDDFTNPAYAKLFHLTIEDYLSREEEVEKINDQVNFKPLEKKIKNKDFQLVEFLAYNNVYAAYSYNSTGIELTQFERGVVDSNITNLISNISRGENLDSIQTILKTQLFQDLNLDNETPIVILPDGPLVNVPFHLLFEQDVRQHISIEDLSTEVRDTIDRNKFSLLSYTDGGTLKSKEANEYQELLEAFNECSLINAMIGGSANFLSGKGANLKGFEKALNSDLIHIASHGSTNRNNRYDNYILLRDENTAPVKMYSYEIEQQNHCPEVVILSACDTGIGAFSNGVGTYSISRAFMAAGAEAVVKSLWKVDDKSTKIFMELLYTKWLEGVSLMNAINHARQSMARDTSFTPHDWSGFVLEGNGSYYLK